VPTNNYFNNFGAVGEQRLYEDLINEVVKQRGIDCYYLPRTSSSADIDLIFGDDPTKKFDEAYPVEIYIQTVDEFEGGELFSKFGLEVKKQARFLIPNRAYTKNVPSTYSRPREGDLIWMTNFKSLFEIKFVEEEYFFYTFGQKDHQYGFSVICEKYRYADEKITTGVESLDDSVNNMVTAYQFNMSNSSPIGTYELEEAVYQGANLASANATATVSDWDRPSRVLLLKHIKGTFVNNVRIYGANSGANFILSTSELQDDVNNKLDNNVDIRTEANTILDWQESNPFGENR
jgi:hypothetical protein